MFKYVSMTMFGMQALRSAVFDTDHFTLTFYVNFVDVEKESQWGRYTDERARTDV